MTLLLVQVLNGLQLVQLFLVAAGLTLVSACWTALRRDGVGMLVIDKHVSAMRGLADRIVVLERGRVAWSGRAADAAAAERWLHI